MAPLLAALESLLNAGRPWCFVDGPIRHRQIDAFVVAAARRMTAAQRVELAAGITDAVREVARAGREAREHAWRERSTIS